MVNLESGRHGGDSDTTWPPASSFCHHARIVPLRAGRSSQGGDLTFGHVRAPPPAPPAPLGYGGEKKLPGRQGRKYAPSSPKLNVAGADLVFSRFFQLCLIFVSEKSPILFHPWVVSRPLLSLLPRFALLDGLSACQKARITLTGRRTHRWGTL